MSGNPDQQEEPKQEENTSATKNLDSDESGRKVENSKPKEHKFARLQSLITSITKKAGKEKETDSGWWKIFGISVACYFPVLVIVVMSFWLFKPANTDLQADQTNQSLTEEQKKQIAEEVNKISTRQQEELRRILARQTAIARDPNSILAKGYIDGQIKQEAEEQAEKATKEEIDKLKADWKGDLFGQITFPVIFAIASIFAAFAVKDILTEILKEQEKEKVKQDIYQELISQIRENIEHNPHLARRLVTVESYAIWLEYRLLDISINQTLNELSQDSGNDSEQQKNNISALWLLCDRSRSALKRLAPELTPKQFELLRDSENKILEAKIRSFGLSESIQNNLLEKLRERSELAREPRKDSESAIGELEPNMDELFRTLMGLLIAKLNDLGETGLARDADNYLSRNMESEKEKRGKEFEAIWGGEPAKSNSQKGI